MMRRPSLAVLALQVNAHDGVHGVDERERVGTTARAPEAGNTGDLGA